MNRHDYQSLINIQIMIDHAIKRERNKLDELELEIYFCERAFYHHIYVLTSFAAAEYTEAMELLESKRRPDISDKEAYMFWLVLVQSDLKKWKEKPNNLDEYDLAKWICKKCIDERAKKV